MTRREIRSLGGGAMVCLAAVLLAAEPAPADATTDYEKLVKEKAAAYVAVKYVLKVEGAFDDSADEAETTGIMIDTKGLVLCGNAALGGGSFGRYGGSRPTEIKVLVGKDTEGLPATLLARDSELGLAWIQVKEPPSEDFAFIDFAKATTPKLGQRLLGLRRMGKYFDRAVVVSEGRVAGQTKKPRELLVPSEGLQAGWGLPVFAEDGSVVGVFVMQMPDEAEQSGDFFSFMGGAQDMFGGLILPAAEVVKATKQARETKGEGGPKEDAKEEPKPSAADKEKAPVGEETGGPKGGDETTKAAGAKATSRPAAPRD